MGNKESMLKLSMAMYIMDECNIGDIMTLLLPHIKYVLGKHINLHSSNVIDIEKLPNEINQIMGYERFPKTIVDELLKRLKCEKVVGFDKQKKRWTLNSDLSNFVKEYENSENENSKQLENLIVCFKNFLSKNCFSKDIKNMTDNQIYDEIFEYLVKHGLIISNHFETINIIKDGKKSFDYYFTEFIIESNNNNIDIINTITRMVEGAYIANAIYNYEKDFGLKKIGNLECYIDTSIMLYLLNLKEPDICNSYLEILNLYESVGIKCKCLKSIVKEIRYIVDHYSNNDIHYGNKKLAFFDNSSSFNGEKSSFLANLEDKIKKLKIEIVGGEETFKNYCLKNKSRYDSLKNSISSEVYYGKETALNTDVESIMYVLDKRGDYEPNYIKDSKSFFITSNLNLVKAANKSLEIKSEKIHLSPIITIDYFTNLIWIFDMKISSDITKNRILSVAHQSNIIKDGFIDRLESIFKENEAKVFGGYTYEQVMQDAIILNKIRKKAGNDENNIKIKIITESIKEKENEFFEDGKSKAKDEITKQQLNGFKAQYNCECEKINAKYSLKKQKLSEKVTFFFNVILKIIFFVLTALYVILIFMKRLTFYDTLSVLLIIIEMVLAFCTIGSTLCECMNKSFFVRNLLYHCIVKNIDNKQNNEISKATERYNSNIAIIKNVM